MERITIAHVPFASFEPVDLTGALSVSYNEDGVYLAYDDFVLYLEGPRCETLETALRAARLASRRG